MQASSFSTTIRAAAIALMSFAAPAAHAQILADSVAEFSGIQGQNGWFNGYYSGDFTSASFLEMATFNGVRWYVDPAAYWTFLGPIGAHPNGSLTTPPSQPTEQWPARRWVSDYEGEVNIDVRLAKIDTNAAGNGVTGRLIVDGLEVWSQWIASSDATGVTYRATAPVAMGSTIDLVLDPVNGNDGADATRMTGVVSVIPTPSAILLITIAGLSLGKRRR